jgi:hypothetical protein
MTDFRENSPAVVALAWFRREDYPRLLTIFEDAHEMHDTWEEWKKSAKEVEERLKTEGFVVERVSLDPDALSDWCRKEGVSITGKARSRFAAQMADKRHRDRA